MTTEATNDNRDLARTDKMREIKSEARGLARDQIKVFKREL